MDVTVNNKNHNAGITEKRSFERVSTRIDARFFYGNLFYSGTVLNVSEKGMFINTQRCLPSDAMCVVIIHVENEILKMIAKVKRTVKCEQTSNGMGVQLISPSIDYLGFVNTLKENYQ